MNYNEKDRLKDYKLELCEGLISFGMFVMFIGFIAGIVITIIGGNNWELMKESPKIMMAFWIDELVMWSGLLLTIGSAVAYNIEDRKE